MNASVNGQPSASSDDDAVTVTRHNGVAVVTLDRADKLNALDPTVVDQLDAALVAVGRDAGVQVVRSAPGGTKYLIVARAVPGS